MSFTLPKFKSQQGVIATITLMLLLSGVLRLGGVGFALAKEGQSDSPAMATHDEKSCTPSADVEAMLELIAARTTELDAQEMALLDRTTALDVSEELIRKNLQRLEQAEARLSATISQVDGASEGDLDRLTAVYEAMKPKVAASVFEQMTPEFAAGFLGRMNAAAAGGILSNLSSDKAYAVSVVLAGRNARAPKE
jgi:flagellar motility protein MotE (MotC chaperone)